jgi:y4mF family transcriptional regulator
MAVNIGEIIQAVRKKSGLTQKGLADLAGVGKTTVFDIENGKTSVRFSNVLRICRVLNISLWTKDPFGEETEVKYAGKNG